MGTRVVVELLLSQNDIQIIRDHDLNLPQICVQAVVETLQEKNALRININGLDQRAENVRLREELIHMKSVVEQLRKEKVMPVIHMPVHRSRGNAMVR